MAPQPSSPQHSPGSREVAAARRFGWSALLVWALLGLGLELAHGFKLAPYLDDELTRLLLRLAHAHGVGLALLVLVYSSAGAPLLAHRPHAGRTTGRLLRLAAILLPLGFFLGAIQHPEGDPGLPIALSPIGAACLLAALFQLAHAAFDKP